MPAADLNLRSKFSSPRVLLSRHQQPPFPTASLSPCPSGH